MSDGNSYITGWSGGANNLCTIMTTIKYTQTGNELWVKRYNGSANDNDFAYWLALDGSGNVYVAGQSVETGSDNDITTIKYRPNGDEIWVRHYDGPPMVMTQAKPSLSMPMATPTSQVITLLQLGLIALPLSIRRKETCFGQHHTMDPITAAMC